MEGGLAPPRARVNSDEKSVSIERLTGGRFYEASIDAESYGAMADQ